VADSPDLAAISDPEIRDLITAPEIPRGTRNDSIMRVMYACAAAGWPNHDILVLAAELGQRWGKYTSANVFRQWTALLSMLRTVRTEYPNPANRRRLAGSSAGRRGLAGSRHTPSARPAGRAG